MIAAKHTLIAASILSALIAARAQAQVAVKAKMIHTMAGEPIQNGVIVVRNGKIAALGSADEVNIPDGFQVLEAEVVTPGLIDAHSVVGLAGAYNYDHDQDQLEHSTAMQPQLRAIDAYNTREVLVDWIRSFGVTTIHTGHAPGELISGQTMIVKTSGNTVEDAVVMPVRAVAATLGPEAEKTGAKSPGTRAKMMGMLRGLLIDAREYRDKRDAAKKKAEESAEENSEESDEEEKKSASAEPPRDLSLEVMVDVLDGKLPLMVTVNRAQDIANALRLKEEFGITLWLDSAAESYLLVDEIKAAGVPVIIHPTMARAFDETENLSYETASKLVAAGIPVALQSGFEAYVPKTRVVLFEAALAAANGLSFEQALATITRDAAKLLAIDDRVGTLDIGKDGDLALFDGDPFEYTTHCTGVVIDGEVVSDKKQ